MSLFSRDRGRTVGPITAKASRGSDKHHSSGCVSSLLGQGSRFEGSVRVGGTLRVDGACEGSLDVGETLVIGRTGEFSGDIRARDVIVCGKLRGTINATESTELQRGCHLEGDVQTRTFIVEEGVFFQGNCRMEDPAGASPDARPSPENAETERAAGLAALSPNGDPRAAESRVRAVME